MTNLLQYATVVFDCDGVVLDSNRIKTEAFRTAALPWGETAAEALVAHHLSNGGVSRYEKLASFFEHILPEHAPGTIPGRDGPDLQTMLDVYARATRSGLMNCPVADRLEDLRAATPLARWMIVSGGDQKELRTVFGQRKLAHLFDAGIFGSPETKSRILEREIGSGAIRFPALFFGDSRLDHKVAHSHGIEFIFVSQWTDFQAWQTYVDRHALTVIPGLASLLPESNRQAPPQGTASAVGFHARNRDSLPAASSGALLSARKQK